MEERQVRGVTASVARSVLSAGSRIALAAPFISGGLGYWQDRDARVQMVQKLGYPRPAEAALLDAVVKVGCGAALGLGILPRFAAAALLANLGPMTVSMYAYWSLDDPAARVRQRNDFIKNVALGGGLLSVIAARRQ